MKETRQVDVWTGVGLMVVSIGVWVLTADLPTPKRGIGPGQYPRVIASTLFILGLVQFLSNIAKGYPKQTAAIQWKQIGRAGLLALMAFVYVRLLKPIGFPLLTPFFLYATIVLFGYKKKKTAAIVSIGATAVIFLLFNVVFMVFLPVGRIF